MLRAAREVLGFIQGKAFVDYQDDLVLRRAIERSVQIIGEASARISKAFREAHQDIPGGL